MDVRFRIPIDFYVIGRTQESLMLRTSFSLGTVRCALEIVGDQPIDFPDPSGEPLVFLKARSLCIEMVAEGDSQQLASLIGDDKHAELEGFIRTVGNRCLRAIRYHGVTPLLHEIGPPPAGQVERLLRYWHVEKREQGREWEAVVQPPDDFFELLSSFGRPAQDVAELKADRWSQIEEAIQDDLPLSPESEFTTNAIEHLRLGNLRLALLEAVIGLEIVLSRFLREYLKTNKGLSTNRISKFLTSGFGLSARVAGLLVLTAPECLGNIDVDEVLKAISWRNKITHGTGHLPDEAREQDVVDAVTHILALTAVLANRAAQIRAAPDIQKISKGVAEEHDVNEPMIWLLDAHRVAARFEFFAGSEPFPDGERLTAIVSDLIERLGHRDPRFSPDEHLLVEFVELPRTLRARWKAGILNELPSS